MEDLRVERGRATRERLLDAGRALFGSRGYEGTSIEAVIEAAGVKRGALYHHFESKKALFDTVLDRMIADISDSVANAARGMEPAAGLRAGCAAWLRAAMDPAVQRIVLLDPPSVVGWARWRELDEIHTLGRLRRSLELAAAGGRLPTDQVDLLAHMVLASLSEAANHIARADDQEEAFAASQSTVDLLLDRLLTAP